MKPIPIRRRVESCGRYRRRDELRGCVFPIGTAAFLIVFGLTTALVLRWVERW